MSECGDDVRAAAWLIRVYYRVLSIPCDGGRAGVASDRNGHALRGWELRLPMLLPYPRATGRLRAASVPRPRSEEHTSELQSLIRISYAVFCLQKKNTHLST